MSLCIYQVSKKKMFTSELFALLANEHFFGTPCSFYYFWKILFTTLPMINAKYQVFFQGVIHGMLVQFSIDPSGGTSFVCTLKD